MRITSSQQRLTLSSRPSTYRSALVNQSRSTPSSTSQQSGSSSDFASFWFVNISLEVAMIVIMKAHFYQHLPLIHLFQLHHHRQQYKKEAWYNSKPLILNSIQSNPDLLPMVIHRHDPFCHDRLQSLFVFTMMSLFTDILKDERCLRSNILITYEQQHFVLLSFRQVLVTFGVQDSGQHIQTFSSVQLMRACPKCLTAGSRGVGKN